MKDLVLLSRKKKPRRAGRTLLWACSAVLMLALGTKTYAAASTDQLWEEANKAYAQGKFEQAKVDYLQLVNQRQYDPNLFYNLGDAWFKLGDKGRAILNYQRALVLQPNFPEASSNLQTALRSAGSPEASPNSYDQLRSYADLFPVLTSIGFWVSIALILYLLLSRYGALATVAKNENTRARALARFGIFCGVLIAATGLGLTLYVGKGVKAPELALVVDSPADLKFGPANSARNADSIGLGQELNLLAERGEWSFCRTASGTLGWIPTRKIERVVP